MATKPSRTRLISIIHVAKKQLAIAEDSHRALLLGVTGKDSLKQMDNKELEAVVERYKKHGFKKTKPKRAGGHKMADQNHARLIRALWLSLYHLGEVRDPSEEAMRQYVKRMSRVDSIKFLTAGQSNAVITGLRDWMKRAGYIRPTNDHLDIFAFYNSNNPENLRNASAVVNAAHVLMAQAKIAFKSINDYRIWLVENGVKDSDHPYAFSAEEIYGLTEKLGKIVREVKANG